MQNREGVVPAHLFHLFIPESRPDLAVLWTGTWTTWLKSCIPDGFHKKCSFFSEDKSFVDTRGCLQKSPGYLVDIRKFECQGPLPCFPYFVLGFIYAIVESLVLWAGRGCRSCFVSHHPVRDLSRLVLFSTHLSNVFC